MLSTKCENWVHGKCAKTKRAIAKLAMHFVCSKCKRIMEGTVDLIKKSCDEMETSPDYNCEVANPACQTTLGYPPVAVHLVGGGATSH